MRLPRYITFIPVLSATLIVIPSMAMPASPGSVPLGSVLQAERAHVGADITSGGATIYDGDRLVTQADGTLHARLGGSQMYLCPDTAAQVRGIPNGFSASLLHGTVIASSSKGQKFELLANGAMIRSVETQATVARVTWINANELLLTSNLGAIQVILADEAKTIEAGNSFRMEIRQEGSGPQDTGGDESVKRRRKPMPAGKNNAVYIWVPVAVIGIPIGVWRALVSPSAP